ncbi:MAG TPA: tetratricopeptide repeat protein, partial [Candidatus Paceibacterota bacterium]|nr:tetratricopeptide repeat protein [Candidatus Paceibacterota bacterium]
VFWNTPFEGGYSTISTFLVTNGSLVTLALIITIALVLVHGFRLFNYQYPDRFTRFIAVSSLIILVPFIALLFVGLSSIVLISYGFLLIGLLIGVSVLVGRTRLASFQYLKDPRSSFFIILLLVLASLSTLSSAYLATSKFVGTVSYNHALVSKDADTAIRRTLRALTFSRNDLYFRTVSALYVSKFSEGAKAEKPDQALLQQYFSAAEGSAQQAIKYNPADALNWQTLASVYQLIVPAKTEGAYDNARSALDRAALLSPSQPAYQLSLANLEVLHDNGAGAQTAIDRAIELKPDYLDAYLLRAQLKQRAGDTDAARDALRSYTTAFPGSDAGFYALGSFELALKNYQSAREALARARALNPYNLRAQLEYVNTLKLLGQKEAAVTVLEELKQRFPNLQGVEAEIDRLKTGQATPITDTKPEVKEEE